MKKRRKEKKETTECKRRKDFRKAARRKAYVFRKDRYLLHGRSNTKEREIQAKVCKELVEPIPSHPIYLSSASY